MEMGLKIISYGCMDCEEGDGHWGELGSSDNDPQSQDWFSAVRKEFFTDRRLPFVQIERGRKTQPKL